MEELGEVVAIRALGVRVGGGQYARERWVSGARCGRAARRARQLGCGEWARERWVREGKRVVDMVGGREDVGVSHDSGMVSEVSSIGVMAASAGGVNIVVKSLIEAPLRSRCVIVALPVARSRAEGPRKRRSSPARVSVWGLYTAM